MNENFYESLVTKFMQLQKSYDEVENVCMVYKTVLCFYPDSDLVWWTRLQYIILRRIKKRRQKRRFRLICEETLELIIACIDSTKGMLMM